MRWNPDPVLVVLGPLTITWYGFFLTVGLLATILVGHRVFKERGLPEVHASNLSFILAAALFIGAHFGYLLFYNREAVMADPSIIFDPRAGLSSHGGGLGVLAAGYGYLRLKKLDTWAYFDAVGLAAVWLFAPIRMGNFMNSEIVGRETDVPWGVIFEAGGYLTPRHPVVLYEVVMNIALVILSVWMHRNRDRIAKGATFLILMGSYFLIRSGLEFFKEFQVVAEGFPLTMGQLLSIPVGLLCLALLWLRRPVLVRPP